MKKLLYLLFAITLLGCDSDDDDNASAQTFLEKYELYYICFNTSSATDLKAKELEEPYGNRVHSKI